MAIEARGYPAWNSFPVTGPSTSPPRPIDVTTGGARVTLSGTTFSARIQISNAQVKNGPAHLFTPAESDWETYTTVTAPAAPAYISAPVRWVRIILDSGTITGGQVEESTRVTPMVNDQAVEEYVGERVDVLFPTELAGQLAPFTSGIASANANASAAQTTAGTALAAGRHTQDRYGGVAAAIAATPAGDVTRLTTTAPISATLLNDGTKNLTGPGIHGILFGQPALGTNPVLKIQPQADGNVYDLARYESTMASAHTSGGDAIQIDVSGNRKMARPLFMQMFGRAPNVTGNALNVVNEEAAVNGNNSLTQDGFFCPTFLACHFDGGVKVRGGGDSFSFIASTITGDKGIDINLQTNVTAWTEASQLLFFASNITADAGTIIRTGTRTRIAFNNMELKAPGANNYAGAAIQLLGSGLTRYDAINLVTWDEEIENATIIGNYIGVSNTRPCVKTDYTNLCQVIWNTLDVGAGNTFALDISANTRNLIVGPNAWHTTAGYEINDLGRGTMGVWQVFGQVVNGRVNHPLGTGRVSHPQRPFKVIKRPDALTGTVSLSGSLTGGSVAEGDLLAILPVGFRPMSGAAPFLTCLIRTTKNNVAGALKHHTWVVIGMNGEVTLGETLPDADTLLEVTFCGESFESPLV